MSLLFKNFEAASRKRNMYGFGMFPANRDLSWIANASESPNPVVVGYSTTPVFDLANGEIQRLTLTGDVASSTIVLNGGTSIQDGTQFYLRIIQDGTGGWLFQWPTNVRNPGIMAVSLDPYMMTSFALEYRNSGWDLVQAAVEGLST